MRENLGEFATAVAVVPQVPTGDTGIVGETIDLQGYLSAEFVIATGTLADSGATFPFLLFHDDAANMGTEVECTVALGTKDVDTSFDQTDDKETKKVTYLGNKRYLRLKVTPDSNGTTAPIAAIVVLKKRLVA
jgi:hypothetical protein